MRLAFFCSSLEAGKDGVGDYTRRLAGELVRRGHPAVIVAANDRHVSQAAFEHQESDGCTIPTLRLPADMSWSRRAHTAANWIHSFKPDWASLQFVPYGFHSKGLCFGLGRWLAAVNPAAPWQVMFHELWLGLGQGAPLKDRLVGGVQRRLVLDFLRQLRPRVIQTQADAHQIVLAREHLSAAILPLFSNIPFVTTGDAWADSLAPLLSDAAGGRPPAREKLYLAGVLGAVYPEWPPTRAVAAILPGLQDSGKRLVLVFLGRNNVPLQTFQQLRTELRGAADVVVAGEKPPSELSRLLQTLDLGVATSPIQGIQKSGSAAAMLEHGLPLLVVRDDWRLRGPETPPRPANPRIFTLADFPTRPALPTRIPGFPDFTALEAVASQFLASLASAAPPSAAQPPLEPDRAPLANQLSLMK
jgi:hypothetical protein